MQQCNIKPNTGPAGHETAHPPSLQDWEPQQKGLLSLETWLCHQVPKGDQPETEPQFPPS